MFPEEPTMNYTPEEVVRRGQALYEEKIRPLVETPENVGKLLCLDVDTGKYEIGMDHYAIVKRVQDGRENVPMYTLRIGYPAAFSRGVRLQPKAS
jgi:hypothetical protein